MTDYLINDELRDTLLAIIRLLQSHSSKRYWKHSDKYTEELRLEDGKRVALPFLSEIQTDLEKAEPVIDDGQYDTKIEELLLVAREMNLL